MLEYLPEVVTKPVAPSKKAFGWGITRKVTRTAMQVDDVYFPAKLSIADLEEQIRFARAANEDYLKIDAFGLDYYRCEGLIIGYDDQETVSTHFDEEGYNAAVDAYEKAVAEYKALAQQNYEAYLVVKLKHMQREVAKLQKAIETPGLEDK